MPFRLESLLVPCLSAVAPFRCPVCGKPPFDGTPGMFCAECLESLPFIVPPYCPGCGGPMDGILDVCPKCLHQPPRPWSQAFSLFHMEGNARLAIMMLKYRNRPEFARSLGRLLGDKLKRELPRPVDMIVPVPLHWTRFVQRGFNQADLICQGISAERPDHRDAELRGNALADQVGLIESALDEARPVKRNGDDQDRKAHV